MQRRTIGDNQLTSITADIIANHSNYKKHALQAAEYYIKTGQLLNEAKQLLPHGKWGDYCRRNLPFSERTARYYMDVAASGLKSATVAEIGLRTASEALDQYVLRRKYPELAPPEQSERRHRRVIRLRAKKETTPERLDTKKEAKSEREKSLQRMHGWGLQPVEFDRPKWGQVMRAQWQTGDMMHIVYVWRVYPPGPYKGSSRAFASIVLERTTKAEDYTIGRSHSPPRLTTWEDAPLPYTVEVDTEMQQETWDIDYGDLAMLLLTEWREQIPLEELGRHAGRQAAPRVEGQ